MKSARNILWLIGSVISINMIYLSLIPLIADVDQGFISTGEWTLREFLQGTGVATSGFWIRLIAIIASLVFIFSWPMKSCRVRRTLGRAVSALVSSVLFIYVTILTWIYFPGSIAALTWVQSAAYAIVMGIIYLANSAEIRNFARIKNLKNSAGSTEDATR